MLLFELDFEEVSKKKLHECWSQLCRIRCTLSPFPTAHSTHKMVYYFTSNTVSPSAHIYVGKDKVESTLSRLPRLSSSPTHAVRTWR